MELLLSQGHDLNKEDNEGKTALFYAFQDSKDNADVVETLVQKGAKVKHLTK